MTTAGVGRANWTGVVSGGIGGTRSTGVLAVVAAAKPAALTADSAPVTATTPATPPTVNDPTRRRALSRSLGWYALTSVVSAAATVVTARPGRRWAGGWLRRRRPTRARVGRCRGARCRGACRIGDNNRLVHSRGLSGRGVQAVGPKRHARQLARDRVLRRRTERGKGPDVARGGDAGDHTGERDQHGGGEDVRAGVRAQGDVLQVASAAAAPDPCH